MNEEFYTRLLRRDVGHPRTWVHSGIEFHVVRDAHGLHPTLYVVHKGVDLLGRPRKGDGMRGSS
jgi:hypothetical protein